MHLSVLFSCRAMNFFQWQKSVYVFIRNNSRCFSITIHHKLLFDRQVFCYVLCDSLSTSESDLLVVMELIEYMPLESKTA